MLRQRVLAALLGLPALFLLLWLNWFFRVSGAPLGSDDLFLLLIAVLMAGVSGWEVSGVVRQRYPHTAPWNGVYTALIVPFLVHAARPVIAGQFVPPVSSLGLLIDSIGATAAVMLLFLGVWSDVEHRGREGWRENLYVIAAGLYLGVTISFLLLLGQTPFHEMTVLFVFVLVFALDTCAYFGGRCLGGRRMAPSISPNKTWAGAVCGLLGACVFSLLLALLPAFPGIARIGSAVPWWGLLLLGASVGIVGQIGDMLESMFKRWGGVKDSGHTLPGHGGFLDRFDSFFLAAPVFYMLLLLLL